MRGLCQVWVIDGCLDHHLIDPRSKTTRTTITSDGKKLNWACFVESGLLLCTKTARRRYRPSQLEHQVRWCYVIITIYHMRSDQALKHPRSSDKYRRRLLGSLEPTWCVWSPNSHSPMATKRHQVIFRKRNRVLRLPHDHIHDSNIQP